MLRCGDLHEWFSLATTATANSGRRPNPSPITPELAQYAQVAVAANNQVNRRGERKVAYETIANDYGLAGKVAVVSGGGGPVGTGLDEGVTNGRAAAILLARAGAKVCVAGRTPELAQHTVDIIKKEGGEAFAFQADVTQEAQCRAVVD